ncbi:NAD-dependent epimerase/dehydratase family protein [Ferruginivarius sediminum]|uniref:NAD-dependent epimerase/dehydratase family protein n=1 Tax=Ferruginivarius sediminum TaxID=2661937 RepID=UPI00137B4564|nr:NAD-dependent epimerase/dehydratase family protein [Ferruginivarius sediminum]
MIDLVTGGAGFLGRHVVHALLARGRGVRVLDIRHASDLPGEVQCVVGQITDAGTVARAMQGVERVFHLAAIPELWARDKTVFDRVNRGGTETVLAAARACPSLRAFVYTSSEVVLVPQKGVPVPPRLDETVELGVHQVIGPYARSKRAAELAVLAAAGEDLPACSVIPTMPVGPGDVSRTPPTRMIADLLAGRTPAYAEVMLNIVDARDAAEGHVLAAERGRLGERYLLSGHNRTMSALLAELTPLADRAMPHRRVPRTLARAFARVDEAVADRITHRPPTAPRDGVDIACRQHPFDNSKARDELGLAPRPLAETLHDTVAWLRQESPDKH